MKEKPINIALFNPTCELAVANGSPYYQAPAILREFEKSLSSIMLWVLEEDDILIVEEHPSKNFLSSLKKLGIKLPKVLLQDELQNELMGINQCIEILPWGWSPVVESKFQNIINLETHSAEFYRQRYSRKNALVLLERILKHFKSEHLLQNEFLPEIVNTETKIEKKLEEWGQIVLKAPYSSSGRGLQVIREKPLNKSKREWINTTLKQQKFLVCEPLLEKLADFSFQFSIDSGGEVSYLGLSHFKTNANGQYLGHHLNYAPPIFKKLKDNLPEGFIDKLTKVLTNELKELQLTSTQSYLSIDALIYKESDYLRLYPCVEINPRMNMGILSLKIQKKIYPGSHGSFEIYNGNDFEAFCWENSKKNPPKFIDGKLAQGFYPLTDYKPKQRFGSYIMLNAGQ